MVSCGHEQCSRECKADENEFCIFHLPISDKDKNEVTQRFIEEINNPGTSNDFSGSKFDNIKISNKTLGNKHNEPIVIDSVEILGNIEMENVVFSVPVRFENFSVDNLIIGDSRFESEVHFINIDIYADTNLTGNQFLGYSHWEDVTHRGAAYYRSNDVFAQWDMSCDFHQVAAFDESTFDGRCYFSNISFSNGAFFRNCRFNRDVLFADINLNYFSKQGEDLTGMITNHGFFEGCYESEIDEQYTNIEHIRNRLLADIGSNELIDSLCLDDSKFTSELRMKKIDAEKSNIGYISLRDSIIDGGELLQSDKSAIYYDLTDSKVGNISIISENRLENPNSNDDHIADYYRFYKTIYTGFDFDSHRDEFEQVNWNIHEFNQPKVATVGKYGRRFGEPDSIKNLEITYLRARTGSDYVGEGTSGSEFLIKEMRYRKKRYLQSLGGERESLRYSAACAILSPDRWRVQSRKKYVKNVGAYFSNESFDLTSGYGERLWKIFLWVGLVGLLPGVLLYPFLGISGERTQLSYPSWELVSEDRIQSTLVYWQEVLSVATEGIYFSGVTFVTLGDGSYNVSGIERFFVLSQSLIGSILLALFVFSLGRRAMR